MSVADLRLLLHCSAGSASGLAQLDSGSSGCVSNRQSRHEGRKAANTGKDKVMHGESLSENGTIRPTNEKRKWMAGSLVFFQDFGIESYRTDGQETTVPKSG